MADSRFILDLLPDNDKCVNTVRELQRKARQNIGPVLTTNERVIMKAIGDVLDGLDLIRDHIVLEAYQRDELAPNASVLGPQT